MWERGPASRGACGPKLLNLIKLRVSQMSGCGYCLDMHARAARAGGETERRLLAVEAWAESLLFTERERAALAWAEAVTLGSEGPFSEQTYAEARARFDEQSLVELTSAIFAIRSWNHFCASFKAAPRTKAAA
jgi:AhpD family alkylhydroperoxidase